MGALETWQIFGLAVFGILLLGSAIRAWLYPMTPDEKAETRREMPLW